MPTAPTVSSPTVMPTGSPTQVSTPAEAFGLSVVGKGLQEAGAVAGVDSDRLAQHAVQIGTMDAKAESDGATVSLDTQQAAAIEKFREENPGIKASQNLGGMFTTLQDLRAKNKEGLGSPLANQFYDEATRLNTVKLQNGLATWAADQKKQYNVKQYAAAADLIARNANLENFDENMKQSETQFQALGAQLGWSKEEYDQHLIDFKGNTAYSLVEGKAAKDPVGAKEGLDKYGEFMNPQQRGVLENQIQSSLDNHNVAAVADRAVALAGNVHPQGGPGVPLHDLVSTMFPGSQITSELRTPEQNAAAHGVANSMHMTPDGAIDFKLGSTGEMQAAVAQINSAGKGLKAIYEGPGAAHSTGPHVHIERIASGSATPSIDAMEDNAPHALAAIAADPLLRGDPILINHAQSQYLTNVNQARAVQNLATQSSLSRLWDAAQQGNITSPAQLQSAYPGALKDWTALGGHGQERFTSQLNTVGNQPTPERTSNFLEVRGGLVNPNTASVAAHQDLSKMDLTRSQYTSLREMQQNVLGKAEKQSQIQANVTSALALEPVKQALAARPDLKIDSPAYNQFTGAFSAHLEEWIADHPGKKPSEADKANIAVSLLAAKPATYTFLGMNTGIKTTTNTDAVPADAAATIRDQYTKASGSAPSDFQVGRIYADHQHRIASNGR